MRRASSSWHASSSSAVTSAASSSASDSLGYWLLARPGGAVCVAALPLLGWGFAHWDHARGAAGVTGIVLTIAAWLALHAGTLWLNAALDRDAGEVLLGRSVAVPP